MNSMRCLDIAEAEASLDELIDAAAERGEPTTITREGRAVAVIIPMADAARLYPEEEFS